ncbi:MAG: class I SAM-dependent methyltransferase, partial [Euryarchaeota archaeon]|nr:class I SAM-dependent methyltransferase [Euryarchaeota archaeon]
MEKEWAEKVKETSRISGTDYWNKRAEDYADYIRTSDYEHGRKIKEVFEREGILKEDFEVLDIAAGPGSVTIPFAESVRKVTAVEPAEEM